MNLSKKLKTLRNTEGYTQKEFAKLLEVGYSSLTNYEGMHRKPNYEFMQKICNRFPQYTLWLMTDSTNVNVIETKNKILTMGEKQ